jgi:hypothetical protein
MKNLQASLYGAVTLIVISHLTQLSATCVRENRIDVYPPSKCGDGLNLNLI